MEHIQSRLSIAERIITGYRDDRGLPEGFSVAEAMTLEMLEYVQERLLAGYECRYDCRSPNTVNSMVAAVMAFVRFCHTRDWIAKVPPLEKLDVDETMKGRPITADEFERMLESCSAVVGERAAESWKFALGILWESGFRVGDLMNFSWDERHRIHPVWPAKPDQLPSLIVPSTQKNGRVQELPLLPGLEELLQTVPETDRVGWVADPEPLPGQLREDQSRPSDEVLRKLTASYSNLAIAEVCGVSEAAVRKWRRRADIPPASAGQRNQGAIPDSAASEILTSRQLRHTRLTKERVGRVISIIGEEAGIVVSERNARTKFASAHDLRRGCALRLIDLGVSAETLKLIMRHKSFSTTEKFYGATRSAQAAGLELRRLVANAGKPELVGGLMGGPSKESSLAPEEVVKLKALLARL